MSINFRDRSPSCKECSRKSSYMFCNLSHEELEDFSTLGMQISLPRGAIIFHEDHPGSTVSVLCSGQVKLSCTSREGKTLILRIARPGDILGLGAAISGERYEVTAETLEPTTLKSVGKEDFLAFLNRHRSAGMHAARALSEDYKSAFLDARRLALAPSAAGRLASILLDLARNTARGDQDLRFTLALTHEDIASLAGTSRETVTRTLNRFQREGLIRIKGTSVTILEPGQLADLL